MVEGFQRTERGDLISQTEEREMRDSSLILFSRIETRDARAMRLNGLVAEMERNS